MRRLATFAFYVALALAVGWTIVRFWPPYFKM
jgi:hypothetical protein